MLLLSHLIFNTYVLLRLLQYSVMHAWMDAFGTVAALTLMPKDSRPPRRHPSQHTTTRPPQPAEPPLLLLMGTGRVEEDPDNAGADAAWPAKTGTCRSRHPARSS